MPPHMSAILEKSAIQGMHVVRHAPRGPLASFVAEIVTAVRGPDAPPCHGRPDGHTVLVFQALHDRDDEAESAGLHAVGTQTSAWHKPAGTAEVSICVHFRPGAAYPFFGVPLRELMDDVVPLEELWGREGRTLREQLIEKRDIGSRVRLLEKKLYARLERADRVDLAQLQLVSHVTHLLARSPAPQTVSSIAKQVGTSERQLRRIFDAAVGMSPKAFARLVRFHRAMRLAEHSADPDWAAIAAEAGYYDQSHLIAECRRLTGTTPAAYLPTWATAQGPRLT
ncbi:MAG: helix-turn-helix transcriptional regulator [Pseudomonadota bacterium]|jgi:AraC-type DNA-binding domain-containing proteins|nr:MAG: AraC family transcriptional regulator [Pseudomonadota bacterium]